MTDRVLARLRHWDRTGCADGRHHDGLLAADDRDLVGCERTIHADLAHRARDTTPT